MNELASQMAEYEELIQKTLFENGDVTRRVDEVKQSILKHIESLDPSLLAKRENLMLAIRLTECIRGFNWIKVCILCGSYQAAFRELRFMIDAMAQAYYIDKNHPGADLQSKLEVFKALCDFKGFMGSSIFKGLRNSTKLRELYAELSNYVHPSFRECMHFIGSPARKVDLDQYMRNTYNAQLVSKCLQLSEGVAEQLIEINAQFQEEFVGSSERA